MDWEPLSASPAPAETLAHVVRAPSDTSYKFQRLRERIRAAIESGDLAGKLPGERLLARRFHVNAKTLSKALTDLAAEGVLQRSIGRGTFVADQQDQPPVAARCLILTDDQPTPLVRELLRLNSDARCIEIGERVRPSLLGHGAIVINASASTPDELYRDLMVRGIPIVETTSAHPLYSTAGVLPDRYHAAFDLARKLILMGHQYIAAVDSPGESTIANAASLARDTYNPRARIAAIDERGVLSAVLEGLNSIICDGVGRAAHLRLVINTPTHSLSVQPPVALVAVGHLVDDLPCSGIYVDPAIHALHIMRLLPNLQRHRASVILLKGTYHDRGTTFRISHESPSPAAAGASMG